MTSYAEIDEGDGAVTQIVSYSELPDSDTLAILASRTKALIPIDAETERRLQARPHRRAAGVFIEAASS